MIQNIAFSIRLALVTSMLAFGALSMAHAQEPAPTAPNSQFYKIGVQHYDAGMMADLVTRQDAIVVVPPNFVIADGGLAPVLSGGPVVTTIGGPNNRPVPGPAPAAAPPVNNPMANNRLPDGVQRIYALRADNSLVIEITPVTSPIRQKGSTP